MRELAHVQRSKSHPRAIARFRLSPAAVVLPRCQMCAFDRDRLGLLAREPTAGRSGIHVCLPGLQSSRSRSPAVSPTPKGRLRASRSPSVLYAGRQEKAAAGGSDQRRLLTHSSRGEVSAIGSRLLAGVKDWLAATGDSFAVAARRLRSHRSGIFSFEA